MSDTAIPSLSVAALVSEQDGEVVLRPEALEALPGGRAVSLEVPAVTPALLERVGGPSRAAIRGAVRLLADAGHEVHVSPALVDAQSSPLELVEALKELGRLALRAPGRFVVEGPLDLSACPDPWVRAAATADLLDDAEHHTRALAHLRDAWRARYDALDDADARRQGEILVRGLDDAPRMLVFEMLRQAWLRLTEGWPGEILDKPRALEVTVGLLGETEKWIKRFRQYTYEGVRRMVVIPTWQCELRCAYCFIPKQDGREMPVETLERSVEMLLTTERDEVMLQFFGGEALIEWERVKHAITYANRRAAEVGKEISYVISSNGWTLDEERIGWLAQHPVRMELSLDGDPRTQNTFRAPRWRGVKSYDHSIATHRDVILGSGIEQYVIMVVHPVNVDAMPANFFHIADLGYRHIQINNMLGRVWKPHEIQSFARGLHEIGRELITRWDRGEELEFINMRHKPMAMRLNGEVTVDHDGRIYGGNGFLHETEHKDKFVVAHLDDLTNVDRWWIDATDNNFLLDWSYRPKITQNNIEVGKIMASFIKWMNQQGYGPAGPLDAGGSEAAEAHG